MSIVLINHYAGDGKNGMEYRPYLMARRWVEMGESVTVVASSFSHLRSKNPNMEGRPIKEEMVDGIRYIWIKGNAYEGNGVGRIKNMLSFVAGLYRYESTILPPECKAVIASSTYPLDIYPARKMARRCGAKFVFELHDMWPLSPIELGGMSPKHPYIRLMQKAENDWCRTADEVVSLLPAAKNYLVEHGMTPDKFHYIPNGIDTDEWGRNETEALSAAHETKLTELKNAGCFVVGYAGGHGISNSLDTLIEAASLIKSDKVRVVMVGDGPEKNRLESRVADMGLSGRVIMLPAVPRQQIPALLRRFDITFFAMKDQPLYRFGISLNKVMDYMMAGKPIVSAINAANDYVADANCGYSVSPGDFEGIAASFDKLALMNDDELSHLGKKGKDYVLRNNDYEVLAKRFLRVLD